MTLYTISEKIVTQRKLFFFLFMIIGVFCVMGISHTKVQNDLIMYLNEETNTRRGVEVMDGEFETYGTCDLMIAHIDYATATEIKAELEDIPYIKSVMFDDDENYYRNASAKYAITFSGIETDEKALEAMAAVRTLAEPYDNAINTTVGVSDADLLAEEMKVITVLALVLIVAVLVFTSKSYAEILVFLITFAVSALLNMGTNFVFDEISFISNSVSPVLQLALGIDYAIILCHRFAEEREQHEAEKAATIALSKAIIEISSSSLTTICGLFAMSFMDYRIGADLSMVLIKAILISLLTVFILMPGLLVAFSKQIDKTQHRNFVPNVEKLGLFTLKFRKLTVPLFLLLTIGAWQYSNLTTYIFSVSDVRAYNLTDRIKEQDRIIAEFGKDNIVAYVVPSGDYEKEAVLIRELERLEGVSAVIGLANTEALDGYTVTSQIDARALSELFDIDYELARMVYATYAINDEDYGKFLNSENYKLPLIDVLLFIDDMVANGYVTLDDELREELEEQADLLRDGQAQLESEQYSRILIVLDTKEESEETYRILDRLEEVGLIYYEEVYLAGNATSNYDLSATFSRDNQIVTIMSILFVMGVLLMTFGSIAIPVLLIVVIQAAIFMNFAVPYFQGAGVYFIGYLVVSSIQMGANIDYAIVITNRYMELRKYHLPKEAVVKSLNESFATVMTSGCILGFAGVLLQYVTTDGTICALGECIGRGTFISMFLVIFILPQILYMSTWLIDKTMFRKKEEGSECENLEVSC